MHASSESEIDQAFAMMTQRKVGALLIAPDGLFIFRAAQIAALTTRYAIPASHERRAFPNAGGLMSYGASLALSAPLVVASARQLMTLAA